MTTVSLIVVISMFVYVKNHTNLLQDKKNGATWFGSFLEMSAIVVLIVIIEFLFPVLR